MKLKLPKIDLKKMDKKVLIGVPVVILVLIMSLTSNDPGMTNTGKGSDNASRVSSENNAKGGVGVEIIEPSATPSNDHSTKLVIALWKEEIPVIAEAVEYYEKKNPDLEVSYKTFSVSNYIAELSTAIERKEEIDVFLLRNVNAYAEAKDKKLAYEIEQNVRSESIDIAKFGTAFKDLRDNGKLYGIPYKRNVYVMFYNKSIFEQMKIPFPVRSMTWKEYGDLARRISAQKTDPKIWGAFMDVSSQSWYMQALQKGSRLDDTNYINFESALQYRMELEKLGAVPAYKDILYWKMHYNTEFQKGFVAMHVAGDWHIKQLLSTKQKFDWDVAPAPHPEDGNQNLSIGNFSVLSVNANVKDVKKAFAFVKYIASEDGAKKIAKNLVLPGFIDDNVSVFYAEQSGGIPENIRSVARQDFVLEYPVDVKGYALANQIVFEEGQAVLEGKQNTKTFVKKVQERMNAAN